MKAKEWMDRVCRLGCIACKKLEMGESPAEIHHIREGRIARNDFLILPLCPGHHRQSSRQSIHLAKPALMRALGVESELDLLAEVIALAG